MESRRYCRVDSVVSGRLLLDSIVLILNSRGYVSDHDFLSMGDKMSVLDSLERVRVKMFSFFSRVIFTPRAQRLGYWYLLTPAFVIFGFFFAFSLAMFLKVCFGPPVTFVETRPLFFTLYYFVHLFEQPVYIQSIVRPIKIAFVSTMICLGLGYVAALFLHWCKSRYATVLLGLLFIPLLLSGIVQVYGWKIILEEPTGIFPRFTDLLGLGMFHIVNTFWGVVVGIVHLHLIFMILPLLVSFTKVDPALEEAAQSLGAHPMKVFYHVILPLTLPGITVGCLITFVLSAFIVEGPSILGGGRVHLVPNLSFDVIIGMYNWAQGAVLGVIALFLVLLILGVFYVIMRRVMRRMNIEERLL